MLSILFNLVGKIILLVALGYILRRKNIITEQFQKDITAFMQNVALPASILCAANNDFSWSMAQNLLLTAVITAVYYVAALLLGHGLSRLLPLDPPARRLFTTMVAFDNIAFIGFPLTVELLGTEGTLYNAVSNVMYILFFFTVGVCLISGERNMRPQQILKVPAALAAIVTFVIYFSPFHLPYFLMDTCSTLGGMVVPISMLVIGCSLAPIPLLDILKDRIAYLVSALRLVVIPFAMLFILRLIPGLDPKVILVCSLLCALPTGTMNMIFASQYGNHVEFASRTTVQGMLLMILTIPIFTTCAITLLGL